MIWIIILILVVAAIIVLPILKGKQNFAKNPAEEGAKFIARHLRTTVPEHAAAVPPNALLDVAKQAHQTSRLLAMARRQSETDAHFEALRHAARAVECHISGQSHPDVTFRDVLEFHGLDFTTLKWKS
ncbi:hypothetical protein [Horticoccus sp. 23ND18S-11]|uniref:hypothetical protein n=1 Tax=Horticoccus sp. 23ND18S-11 TaxID=3391832 RepID=UPI0039C9A38E